jgi:prepilin-type processing-associated H-X9-DG protein
MNNFVFFDGHVRIYSTTPYDNADLANNRPFETRRHNVRGTVFYLREQ